MKLVKSSRFFLTGNCTAGASCRHHHDVKRLAEIHKAHSGTINSVILADGMIWTAGSDTSIRSWRPVPGPEGLQIEPAGAPVECGESVTSLLWDPARKALVCGLNSGNIRVFTREPLGQLDLVGHTGAVHSLVVFQNVFVVCLVGRLRSRVARRSVYRRNGYRLFPNTRRIDSYSKNLCWSNVARRSVGCLCH